MLSRRLGLGLFGLILLAALAFVVLRSGPFAPTRVTVEKVGRGSLTPALFGIGTVEARRAYLIGPTTAGRVGKVYVDIGETVKAGQLLAEMDPVDFDERLTAIDAAIARAGNLRLAAQAQQGDAAARKNLAVLNADRTVELGNRNFISASAVDGKLQERASAVAAVSIAVANLSAAQQELKRLTAERAGVQQQRDNLRLLAPSDGLVINRDAESGSTVIAGQAVLRLIEPASLWIRVRFDQSRSTGLASGLDAEIVLRSNPSTSLAGKVARVDAVSDSVTEERVALVSFDALPVGLAVGEMAEVTLALAVTAPAILISSASVKRRADPQGERRGVWRVEEGKLRFVPVRLGQSSLDGRVQVLDGLTLGDVVVVFSEKELAADSRIKIVDVLLRPSP